MKRANERLKFMLKNKASSEMLGPANRRLPAPSGPLDSEINAKVLAECLEQLVVDAADDAKAVGGAISKNGAASAFANDAIDRAAVITASGQGLLHRYDQGVIIVDDVAAINGRISTVVRVGTVVIIIIRITIPVAVTIKGRTDPTIIAMMPMMPTSVMLVIAVMPTAVIPTAVLLVSATMPGAMLSVPAAMTSMPAAVMPVRAATPAAVTAAPALSVALDRHRQARKRLRDRADHPSAHRPGRHPAGDAPNTERRISVRIPVSTIGGSMGTTALWPVYCFGVK